MRLVAGVSEHALHDQGQVLHKQGPVSSCLIGGSSSSSSSPSDTSQNALPYQLMCVDCFHKVTMLKITDFLDTFDSAMLIHCN